MALVELIRKIGQIYAEHGDTFRSRTFIRGAAILKQLDKAITSIEDVKDVPGIGTSLAECIDEYCQTGQITRLQDLQKHDQQKKAYQATDPYYQTIQLFLGIFGVGQSLAQQWYQQGHRSLKDLRHQPM